jgi:hypothetical protein
MLSNVRRTMVLAAIACAPLFAASHRNGPLLLEDQTANLNDLYVFRSYETGRSNYVVMSMSVQGFQNPDNGPSYYKFSDSVLYRFNVNNQRGLDGNPDIQIDFVFQTTLRPNPTFVSYLGPLNFPVPDLRGGDSKSRHQHGHLYLYGSERPRAICRAA